MGALRDTKPVSKIETGVLRFCFLKTEEKPDPIFSFERHGTRTGRRARFERSLLTAGGGRRAPRVALPGGPARVRRPRSRRRRRETQAGSRGSRLAACLPEGEQGNDKTRYKILYVRSCSPSQKRSRLLQLEEGHHHTTLTSSEPYSTTHQTRKHDDE